MTCDAFVPSHICDQLKSPSLEHITESPYYKVLLDHASMLEADVSKKDAEIGKLSSDRYQLLESRKEWEEGILVCFAIAWVT